MNPALQQLKNEGCDIDAALARCVNDEEFLLTCMKMAIEDKTFEYLGTSLEQKNVEGCFRHTHSLKGVCANVGLTPLYMLSSEMTEILRAGSLEGIEPLYGQLMGQRAHVMSVINAE